MVVAVRPLLRVADQESVIGAPEIVESLHEKVQSSPVFKKAVSVRHDFHGMFKLCSREIPEQGQKALPAAGISNRRQPPEDRPGALFQFIEVIVKDPFKRSAADKFICGRAENSVGVQNDLSGLGPKDNMTGEPGSLHVFMLPDI